MTTRPNHTHDAVTTTTSTSCRDNASARQPGPAPTREEVIHDSTRHPDT
jgi:hypothetical protein